VAIAAFPGRTGEKRVESPLPSHPNRHKLLLDMGIMQPDILARAPEELRFPVSAPEGPSGRPGGPPGPAAEAAQKRSAQHARA
jgi:hypothetical protein